MTWRRSPKQIRRGKIVRSHLSAKEASVTAIELIAAERQRQIDEEGWTPEHDDEHSDGQLALAAASYAVAEGMRDAYREVDPFPPGMWPWDESWWKPCPDDRKRELVKAGALIVAEIERLQRQEARDA